jgi:class 3 adenylate cyclase
VSASERLPAGTVTLLLADVEGSSELWETDSDTMGAAIARLDEVVAESVAATAGVRPVEQGEGDSFVVAFTRASDAIACALALHPAPVLIGGATDAVEYARQGDLHVAYAWLGTVRSTSWACRTG